LALFPLLRRAPSLAGCGASATFGQQSARSGWSEDETKPVIFQNTTIVNDLIFTGTIILFFVVSALYVRFCDKL
jgi:hypothetical protein